MQPSKHTAQHVIITAPDHTSAKAKCNIRANPQQPPQNPMHALNCCCLHLTTPKQPQLVTMEQDPLLTFSTITRAKQGQHMRFVTVEYQSQTTETCTQMVRSPEIRDGISQLLDLRLAWCPI